MFIKKNTQNRMLIWLENIIVHWLKNALCDIYFFSSRRPEVQLQPEE